MNDKHAGTPEPHNPYERYGWLTAPALAHWAALWGAAPDLAAVTDADLATARLCVCPACGRAATGAIVYAQGGRPALRLAVCGRCETFGDLRAR